MPLVLAGATSGQATIQATDAATVTLTLPATSGTLAVGGTTPSFSTLTVTGNTNLATSSGSVGIGTSSPEGTLHVLSGSAGTVTAPSAFPLVLEGTTIAGMSVLTSNTGEGRIWFGDPDDNDVGRIEYAHSTNAMTFRTNAADRMVIDSSGNVLVSTTTPSNNSANRGNITIGGSSSILSLQINGSQGGYIYHSSANLELYNQVSGNMIFGTNNTERMRISSSGELLVGTTSGTGAAERFALVQDNTNWVHTLRNSSASQPYGSQIWYTGSDPNNTSNFFFGCYGGGAQTLRLNIRSNGGIGNYSGNNVNLSDAREKTNIELAGSYLDKICAIPVKTFNYIDQNLEEDDGLTLGVIAQDVQAVAPELVSENNWAAKDEPEKMRLSIYQTDLQYALMKSIQELKATVDAQAARIAALEGAK